MIEGLAAIYIFILAGFTGYEIISKVPVILHTPLMSGSNFVHGIVLVGAMVALGIAETNTEQVIGFIAVLLGAGNAVGGYVVTERMLEMFKPSEKKSEKFDIFTMVSRAEWDTLLFFFGVIVSVGGLGFMGYLALVSEAMYVQLGATYANVLVGILSAIVDNIPVMFAVLTMTPDMSLGQWLLVTLTAGVGGSLLSIGSAAGVALMGQSKGYYTFVSHLKWIWAIALGYAASILVHLWINSALFDVPI